MPNIGHFQPTNTHCPLPLSRYLSYLSPTREAAGTKQILISSALSAPLFGMHVSLVCCQTVGRVKYTMAHTLPAATAASRRQRLTDASPARLFAHGRKVFLRARRKIERALEARDEGQAVGWGQIHHGAHLTRGDTCEETAETERC